MNYENDTLLTRELLQVVEKSKAKIEWIIEELADVFCIIDSHGHILKANSKFAKLLNVKVDLSTGHLFSEVFDSVNWTIFCQMLEELQSSDDLQKSLDFELPVKDDLGQSKIIFWIIKKVINVSQDHIFALIGRDISSSVLLQSKNKQLEYQRSRLEALVNSSLHGYFTINRDLLIGDDFSIKAQTFLGEEIAGKHVADVLKLEKEQFSNFAKLGFQKDKWEVIGTFAHYECQLHSKTLRVEFVPVLESDRVERILGIITDITVYRKLELREAQRKKTSAAIVQIVKSKAVFLSTLNAVKALSEHLTHPETLKRMVHTIKGEFGFFECTDWVEICHNWESSWIQGADRSYDQANTYANNQRFLAALNEKITKFIDEYRDVLALEEYRDGDHKESMTIPRAQVAKLLEFLKNSTLPESAQLAIEEALSVPMNEYFSWWNDLWSMSALRLNKQVEPIQWSGSMNLFLEPYSHLFRELIHIIRNSIDHGIELPAKRQSVGKPKKGRLSIQMSVVEDGYRLIFKDDGSGVDLAQLKSTAQARGLPAPKDEQQCMEYLFLPEFSTAKTVSDLSGRGVGLSAVRSEAILLGGGARALNDFGKGFEVQVWFKKSRLSLS